MKVLQIGLIFIVSILMTSCNRDEDFTNHRLVGLYNGMWDTNITMVDIEIAPSVEENGLEFSLSIFRSYMMDLQSETEFTLERFEENGTSMEISGVLIGDTLFVENDFFNVMDPSISGVRTGKFVRVE